MDEGIKELKENHGKKIMMDASYSIGPFNIMRSTTDKKWIVRMCLFILLWITVSQYAYRQAQKNDMDHESQEHEKRMIPSKYDWDSTILSILATKYLDSPGHCAWYIIVGCIALSGVIAFFYMMLLRFVLRWHPKLVVKTAISMFLIVTFIVSVAFYIRDEKTGKWSEVFWYFMGTFAVASFIFHENRKGIPLACEIIKEASETIIWFPSLIILSVIQFTLISTVLAFSVLIFVSLFKIPELISDRTLSLRLAFCSINYLGFSWLASFINGFILMVLCGTFSNWYWTREKKLAPKNTVTSTVKMILRNHLGTLAFGSFIMVIGRLILSVVKFLTVGNACDSILGHYLCPLVRIASTFLEILADIMITNTYIVCVSHGTNLIQSAIFALNLIDGNGSSVIIIDQSTRAVLVSGQVFASVISCIMTSVMCHMDRESKEHLSYTISMVMFGSFILTTFLFRVLSSAVDALFLSALEDLKTNDGSEEKPYFMNLRLRVLLQQSQTQETSHSEDSSVHQVLTQE
ncbi:hypothetical protein QAD02_011137 [Eretmocerus hayati]|uniref:Uncharacterized protein n=1 Tax=Eretmocerus hayati TaxID=131215 RepID=A0ACC2NW27_9HYME|nr:hypothetical protein QAD02_011137 [Eretmocerus hayati]